MDDTASAPPPLLVVFELALAVDVWSPSECWGLLICVPGDPFTIIQLLFAVDDAPDPVAPCPLAPLVPPQMIAPGPLAENPLSTFFMITAIPARSSGWKFHGEHTITA